MPNIFCWGLLLIVGVYPNGDGTVVDERHFHVCAKFSRTYFFADEGRECRAEIFVKRYGGVGAGGTDVARAVAFLRARH